MQGLDDQETARKLKRRSKCFVPLLFYSPAVEQWRVRNAEADTVIAMFQFHGQR